MKKWLSFAVLVPLASFTLSATLVLTPFLRGYSALLKMAAESSAASPGDRRIVVPEGSLASYALSISALRELPAITALNAPAQWTHLLICLAMDKSANWRPAGMRSNIWRVLSFPFYALPAWFFVGRGLDAFLKRVRLGWVDALVSILLSLLFLGVSAGIRFGLTARERQGPASWFMAGFACWAILIALPFAAWLWQRGTSTQR